MRSTSLEIYARIKSEGLLKGWRLRVYETLLNHGPMTVGEIWQNYFKDDCQRSSISGRPSELERMGAIQVAGERECGYTGNLSTVWEVTNRVPLKLAKPPQRHQCSHCRGKGYVISRKKPEDATPPLF